MRKKNIINLALTIIFILIPIFSYGITLDELSIDYALAIYTSVTTKLLFILIISIDTIISVIIIKKNRNKNTKHYICVIGIIAILGIIVSGTITINNLVEKSNQFDEFHRLHPFYVG